MLLFSPSIVSSSTEPGLHQLRHTLQLVLWWRSRNVATFPMNGCRCCSTVSPTVAATSSCPATELFRSEETPSYHFFSCLRGEETGGVVGVSDGLLSSMKTAAALGGVCHFFCVFMLQIGDLSVFRGHTPSAKLMLNPLSLCLSLQGV